MKKKILSIILIMGIANYSVVEAVNIHVSVNVGAQPAWGPVGYNYAPYYYMPDINVYYNVDRQIFYYSDRGNWISARYLPSRYRHYDLYGLYKVVLTDARPWLYNHHHTINYRQYRGRRNQIVIRNSHDMRYRDSRKNDVRWYRDDRPNNHARSNKGRDYNYGRQDNRPKQRSNSNKGYDSGRQSNNRQNNRSTTDRRDNNRQPEMRSVNMTSRTSSSQRQANDRTNTRSSSQRSDNGRSSSSARR